MDPIEIREKNGAKSGTKTHYGPTHQNIGFLATLEAAKNSAHWKSPLKPGQGRGIATGFWFNIGGESSAAVHVAEDGTVVAVSGSPDIGGSRASIGMMVAEALQIPAEKVRTIVADTASIGFTHVTGGSRVTFATGMAATMAAEKVVDQLKQRAAMIWDITPDAVDWRDGQAFPAGTNAGAFEPLSLADIALKAARTGGPVTSEVSVNAQGAGPGFGAHICDVEVDKETGQVTIVRYTAVQDVGRAIHPSYVEGQIQGGAVQGIGWALNEEYIYDKNGKMDNPGLPRLPLPGGLRPADDRGDPGRGAEPAPSVRRARRGRGADHPADGRGRQRDPRRDRAAHGRACRCRRRRSARRWTWRTATIDAESRHLGHACQRFTGGKTELEVAATTFRRLVLELDQRFPGLGKQVEEGMAVAIDGEIFQDAYSAQLRPDSEIVLIPKIGGG